MPEMPVTNGEDRPDLPAADEADDLTLEQRAEQAERERDEYFSLLRQAQADFENAHQRNRREREQEQKYRNEPLARDILPAVDNLDRALRTTEDSGDKSPLVEGVSLARDHLLDALMRHGITPLHTLDQPFDPNRHQALAQAPVADKRANTVVQVVEGGYLIHDRVLRPAKVIISSEPASSSGDDDADV